MSQYKDTIFEKQVNKELIKKLRNIAKFYKVKAKFVEKHSSEGSGGFAVSPKGKIEIRYNSWETRQVVCSLFFHEIAHCLNFRNKKYIALHTITTMEAMTADHARKLIRTSLRGEKYTDKIGKSLMKLHFPEVVYIAFYDCPYVVKIHKEQWLQQFRDHLEMLDKKRKK